MSKVDLNFAYEFTWKQMTEPQQRWWKLPNRTILVLCLLLCVALSFVGAYFLRVFDLLH